MTSPDDVIFLKFSEIYGQYFPLSNFKKKDTLVFSSLSSIRLGLSPKGLVKRKRPSSYPITGLTLSATLLHAKRLVKKQGFKQGLKMAARVDVGIHPASAIQYSVLLY